MLGKRRLIFCTIWRGFVFNHGEVKQKAIVYKSNWRKRLVERLVLVEVFHPFLDYFVVAGKRLGSGCLLFLEWLLCWSVFCSVRRNVVRIVSFPARSNEKENYGGYDNQ